MATQENEIADVNPLCCSVITRTPSVPTVPADAIWTYAVDSIPTSSEFQQIFDNHSSQAMVEQAAATAFQQHTNWTPQPAVITAFPTLISSTRTAFPSQSRRTLLQSSTGLLNIHTRHIRIMPHRKPTRKLARGIITTLNGRQVQAGQAAV